MSDAPTPDERADALAAAQHSAISRRQALEAGLTRHQIAGRLSRRRWLHRVRGVFVVAAAAETWQQHVMVACLANPAGTVASHLTAAALHGLAEPPEVPHVTVPSGASNRLPGAIAHRSRRPLDLRDLSVVDGVPATSAARTLVDCAGLLGYDEFCSLLDTALIRRLTTVRDIRAAADRAACSPGRKGLPLVEQALEVWAAGRRPDSPPEVTLQRLMLKWGLAPVRQHPIFDEGGRFVAKVDLAIPALKLILEYDGQEFHGPRRKAADAARQARLEALGWRVLRVTKFDLRSPERLRVRLRNVVDGCAA